MSGSDPTTEQPSQTHRADRLAAVYHGIDRRVFNVEAAIVTAATAMMIVFVFLDLAFTFVNGIKLGLFPPAGEGTGGLTGGRLLSALAATGLVVALIVAGVRQAPRLRERTLGLQLGVSLAVLAVTCGFLVMFATVHARWTCLLLVVAGGIFAFFRIRSTPGEEAKVTRRLAIWALAMALLIWFTLGLPDRYSSWTLPYALFLLLWTGFIGASMATSQGRHLRIDAVRKAVPPRHVARYNGVSLFVAAAITGVLCYLSWRYLIARYGNPHAAGEIPDWLKVLAIPISLSLVTVRFLMRSILAFAGYVEPEVSEVVIPAETKGEG